MLPKTQIKSLMRKLGIKEDKNAIFFISRLEGWINSNGNSKLSLIKGINTILGDIHTREQKSSQKEKKINLEGIKNPLLKKYAKEIIELHNQGLGARLISKTLWEAHRAKISYSSIYRLLKKQKALTEAKNG